MQEPTNWPTPRIPEDLFFLHFDKIKIARGLLFSLELLVFVVSYVFIMSRFHHFDKCGSSRFYWSYFTLFAHVATITIPIIIRIIAASARGIQNGARTHHQDHSITWSNFNTIKVTPSSPRVEGPL